MKVAFIGLGIMGSRMAQRLVDQGIDLIVYNRSKKATQPLVDAGAKFSSSARECVSSADIVFTMLSTPEAVEMIAWDVESGFVEKMKKNALWVDCSTVNPTFSKKTAKSIESSSVRYLEAPVAGSKNQSAAGELVFFAGGNSQDIEEVQALFDIMGKKTLHVGKVGMGASLKILVNSLLAQSMVMFSETVILGEKLGLDKDFLLNFLPHLPVTAPFIKSKIEKIKSGKYEVEFPLEWILKDLHLLMLTAYESQVPVLLAGLTKELFARAVQQGKGREDFSAIHGSLEG